MSENTIKTPLISKKTNHSLTGELTPPGDKSISHRSLIFAALANGVSTISGILEGEDVLRTALALENMGVEIDKNYGGIWKVNGSGLCGLMEPTDILNMGNSGTSARLLMGLLSSFSFKSFLLEIILLEKDQCNEYSIQLKK